MARRGKPVILIFGEGGTDGSSSHGYDAQALRALLPALHPGIEDAYDIKPLKDPPSLTRSASPPKVHRWMDDLQEVITAQEALRPVHAVLVHQDADAEDPDLQRRQALLRELQAMRDRAAHRRKRPKAARAGRWSVIAVVPVRMTEAWWLLFPQTVRTLAPVAWRDLALPKGSVEKQQDPAQELTRRTDQHTGGKRVYSKADSPRIATALARRILSGEEPLRPARPASASWNRFIDDVGLLAESSPES